RQDVVIGRECGQSRHVGGGSQAQAPDHNQGREWPRMMRQMRIIHTMLFTGGLLACAALSQAQEIKASLRPTIDTKRVHAGQAVKARLAVHLSDNFRVPSDRPGRNFVPTTLTIDVPAGVTVDGSISYWRPSQAQLAGQKTMVLG